MASKDKSWENSRYKGYVPDVKHRYTEPQFKDPSSERQARKWLVSFLTSLIWCSKEASFYMPSTHSANVTLATVYSDLQKSENTKTKHSKECKFIPKVQIWNCWTRQLWNDRLEQNMHLYKPVVPWVFCIDTRQSQL